MSDLKKIIKEEYDKKNAVITPKSLMNMINEALDAVYSSEVKEKNNKLNENLMFYRISKNSLQSNKFRNLFWVWKINKKFNNLSLFENISVHTLKQNFHWLL